MEQNPPPQHIKVGKTGEDIACRYLVQKGYKILDRNFRRKCGEIDIICSISAEQAYVPYGTKIVFFEVKTLDSRNNLTPEENVTYSKQKKIIRTCQLYLSENNLDLDSDWQIDIIAIDLDRELGKAKIRHMENALSI